MSRLLALTAAVLALAPVSGAFATTYYVSPSGADANTGLSTSAPWRTVAKVNATALAPGDAVLFQGAQRFTDATLMPSTSGTSTAPIRFASYGSGRAIIDNSSGAVWLAGGTHDLTFDNLELTASGGTPFASAGSGAGTYDITLQNSFVHDASGTGIRLSTPADHDWTIAGNTVRHIGDSGLIVFGSRVAITGNTISDTGWNTAVTYGKHGIYAKGPDMTIAFNDISAAANGQAVSIRFHGARVYGNTIHDTPYAIAFFDYDTAAAPQGTSYVYANRMWNVGGWAFYYAGELDPQGRAPSVSFVVASNTVALLGGSEAVNVSEVPSAASVVLANNVFTGSYGSAYRGCATCSEHHNDWYGASSNVPGGTADLAVAPGLGAAPTLTPATSAPVVDRGTSSVAGLGYSASCDGAPLHYCGAAPELGAVEIGAIAAPPPPPPAPTPTPTPAPAPAGDTTPPTVAFANLTSGSWVRIGFVAGVTAQDASGIRSLALAVDGTTACTSSTGSLSCALRTRGWHTLTATAVDGAGNKATAQLTVRVK